MKKKTLALLLITGAVFLNTTPCFAASQSIKVSVSESSDKGGYSQLPAPETVLKDTGFSPKLPVSLAGSFEFDSGRITESSTLDANGNVTNRLKGISFNYVQTKNNTTTSVSFSAEPDIGQTSAKDTVGTKYGELTLYYSDKQANSVSWAENGVFYMLIDVNKKISKDELHKMAKEIIDIKQEKQ